MRSSRPFRFHHNMQLNAAPQVLLDRLVRELGYDGAARRIGCASATVERLSWDGSAAPRTVERIQKKLEAML